MSDGSFKNRIISVRISVTKHMIKVSLFYSSTALRNYMHRMKLSKRSSLWNLYCTASMCRVRFLQCTTALEKTMKRELKEGKTSFFLFVRNLFQNSKILYFLCVISLLAWLRKLSLNKFHFLVIDFFWIVVSWKTVAFSLSIVHYFHIHVSIIRISNHVVKHRL